MNKLTLALAILLVTAGCSKGSSSSSSSSGSMTINGALSSNSTTSLGFRAVKTAHMRDSVDLTSLQFLVECSSSPPTQLTSSLDSSGNFSVTLPAACQGVAVSMSFIDKTDGQIVGLVQFQGTQTDMSGNKQTNSSVNLASGVNLGAIAIGSDGNVTIPAAQVASALASASNVSAAQAANSFDPTGTWYFKAYDGTLPAGTATDPGYQTVTSDCSHGPCIGFPMTMFRMAGHPFTPNSGACTLSNGSLSGSCTSADGTTDSSAARYGLSIWGQNFTGGVGACGAVTGFTSDEARAFGQIDLGSGSTAASFGGNTVSFGHFSFTAPSGYGGDVGTGAGSAISFNQPWMRNGGKATYTIQNCQGVTISNAGNSYQGFACRAPEVQGNWPGTADPGHFGWQVGIQGGGCFNTDTSAPVNVTNWAAIGTPTDCSTTDVSSTFGTGFSQNTCHYTGVQPTSGATAINVTCTNVGGSFADSSGSLLISSVFTPSVGGAYLGQSLPILNSGDTCKSAVTTSADNAHQLAAYQCYANDYYANGGGNNNTGCSQNYSFNWAATSPSDFVSQSGQSGKPNNAFITNILVYSADGQTGTLEDVQNNVYTVSTGVNSNTMCNASRHTMISFQKMTSARVLTTLIQRGHMDSPDDACQAAAKQALAGNWQGGGDLPNTLSTQKMMFYLDTTN